MYNVLKMYFEHAVLIYFHAYYTKNVLPIHVRYTFSFKFTGHVSIVVWVFYDFHCTFIGTYTTYVMNVMILL